MANTKVTSRVLANDAVLTANITDANITTAKIADNAVTGDKVADDVALAGNPTTTTQSAGNNTTRIATTAFVTTAVANIVDSAPSALDTLNELAAALGDDANFSTTVTNSIATKAPLANPTFTGALTIDDITIDGSTISDGATMTLDAGSQIVLDADGGLIQLKDGGTEFAQLKNSSSDLQIISIVDDKDIIFRGSDNGTYFNALTLDMSEAGAATFNDKVIANASGGVITLGANGHVTSKQSLDTATAGGRFIGESNRGHLGEIAIEQTADSTDGGYIRFATAASGTTSSTTHMTLASNGKLALHSGLADTQLHVKNEGGIEVRLEADSNNSGQEDCFIRFYTDGKTQEGIAGMDNNNSSTLFSGNTENAMVFGTVSNLPVVFATNNTERVQITNSGNLGINCAGSNAKLEVVATSGEVFRADANNGAYRLIANQTGVMMNGNVGIGNINPARELMVNGQIEAHDGSGSSRVMLRYQADGEGFSTANSAMLVAKNTGTSRSINCGGTVNASGADYAEYMKKADSCGTIAKGDVAGVDSDGKLTKTYSAAKSFVIKSTNPSYVGGDTWGNADLELTEEQTEIERQKYDRIAFSGQVPVNITGSFNVGDYVYPQKNGTGIQAVAKSTPTFEEYQLCVGKIWTTMEDGRPLVAVKIG